MCLFSWRSSSRHSEAEKNVTCSTKSTTMLTAAYMQNELRAGSAEDVEMAKATKSVREVTVIEVAACASASRMRFGMVSFLLVASKA